ncbi:MAG: NAD-dependent epimerase/dehydratase family protein [Gemmatimonadetes bacterium]|uniref:NAD-dependent epimerase/dehydratase family protein n=1 Tax=Candidatus Kutchimonas denitrificans TaxID=3056748 RepID=A0AAE4Z7C6_9BACT|nr:NAD-dependent epimerase/dehydratase family protein [Gemmatimonadota bacterium]NIR75125.1 NAD-dependent epimerase/dehydratase family protein [Candidatus Kutchimonas denitrificans]NIS00957.1 NAD-dependent epimerase/dehydratase family protein [Gemmatimonadota bacterium]NIT66574.1 NAD-dependent epimerase/dehydratase family protein [Gemmatimonadota bacterium]NIU52920.1 NAD-dependent epimerase/dehydratase family protein [Gemmatimonadota bacterium]
MKVLIIGGTRFVGHHTAIALHEAGHSVSVFTRGKHPIELPDGVEHIAGDRKNDADLEAAASKNDWDVVWDNMSYTAEDAGQAVRIFGGRCGLLVHTSTLAVYSVCEGIPSPYREEDFERGRPLRERLGTYPYDYGIKRREGEEVLMKANAEDGFPFVTVRLPAVLGPRDYSLRAWSYWRRILEDGRIILPDAGVEMHRAVYSGDVVTAVVTIMEKGAELAGNAYNLGSREIVSLRGFVQRSAAVLGKDPEIIDIPSPVIARAGIDPDKLSPYTTWGDHLHSIAKAQHELEYRPTPLEDWLAPTIEWHLEHRRDAEPPGWELRDQEARLIERWRSALEALGL